MQNLFTYADIFGGARSWGALRPVEEMVAVFRSAILHLVVLFAISGLVNCVPRGEEPRPAAGELRVGFTAVPDSSYATFQPLLKDPSGSFSLGFYRVQQEHLSLAVLHLPSGVPLWSATTSFFPRWAGGTRLFFNGSLVLSDPHTGVFWSTRTSGDRVRLSNTSNLIVENLAGDSVLWQSFDFPTDTLVENQNFTAIMALVSSNGLYSMRLGGDYIGFYAKFAGEEQMYFKHGALQAKMEIKEGEPIYMTIKPDGYMGIFQTGPIPADVEAFNTFQRNLTGLRRVRLEPDGNFKGYYWTGTSWSLDYQAISDFCQLPSSCGSYSLCRSGNGCSCLDNRTDYAPGACALSAGSTSGNLCGEEGGNFRAMRTTGVELPFKELMEYQTMASMEACEASCAANCSCWGVVYSNSSGFCYSLDFPVQTLLAVEDDTKLVYFKVRQGARRTGPSAAAVAALASGLVLGAIVIISGIVGTALYRSRRGVSRYVEDEGIEVGPYKDLGSAASASESFRSIESSRS